MESEISQQEWRTRLKEFEKPSRRRAIWQIVNSAVPYAAIVVLMYFTIQWGWPVWATILLAIPAAAFLVRMFIIFHDCGHGSFFKSQRANRIVGTAMGVLTFTSFGNWRYGHGIHHSTSGNLDRRTIGEVWTLTVEEYKASPWYRRIAYRVYRNPFVMFGVAPLLLFVVSQRLPDKHSGKKQIRSVWLTNGFIAAIALAATLTVGIGPYLLIQMSIMYFAGMAGIWLFYVQHQFDPGYWERAEEWDFVDAALEGSSYYKLPKVLQWFTGNIGLHHVHHLRPRIPNYNLQRALDSIPELQLKDHLTIRQSLRSVFLNLWDEANKQLISFRQLDRRRAHAV